MLYISIPPLIGSKQQVHLYVLRAVLFSARSQKNVTLIEQETSDEIIFISWLKKIIYNNQLTVAFFPFKIFNQNIFLLQSFS